MPWVVVYCFFVFCQLSFGRRFGKAVDRSEWVVGYCCREWFRV